MNAYPFDVKQIAALAVKAGDAVMEIYGSDFAVYEKDDMSPVTDADLKAEGIIFEGLHALTPDIPLIGEEHLAAGGMPDLSQSLFWLVDPIDGTADFVKKNGEFTVNIALIKDDAPVFGVVYAPVRRALYYTVSPVEAVKEQDGQTTVLKTRAVPSAGYSVLNSRTHCDETVVEKMLTGLKIADKQPCGSSLKFCLIAEGKADVYPCSHKTKEWDTAAAHAVLRAAGGEVYDAETGRVLTYRKDGLRNPTIISFGQKGWTKSA